MIYEILLSTNNQDDKESFVNHHLERFNLTEKTAWLYMDYVTNHIHNVQHVGKFLHVGSTQLIYHDQSKFTPIEFVGYANWRFGEKDKIDKTKWANAWLHHLHNNEHHPEHWLLSWKGDPVFYIDIGENICGENICVLPMPEKYIREMIADWMAMSKAITGSWDISDWVKNEVPKMLFHSETKNIIGIILRDFGYIMNDSYPYSYPFVLISTHKTNDIFRTLDLSIK